MKKFIKGRYYKNNKLWFVEDRKYKTITLKSDTETVECDIDKDKLTEFCFPNGGVLRAVSIVGRPQHYTEEENRELRIKASKAYNKKAYKTITFNVEPELAKELKETALKTGIAQRQIVMLAVKEYLEKMQMEKANDSVKKTMESFNVILSYIQEQDTETGKMTPIVVTPYIDNLGLKS